jgi:hypothetical protein
LRDSQRAQQYNHDRGPYCFPLHNSLLKDRKLLTEGTLLFADALVK